MGQSEGLPSITRGRTMVYVQTGESTYTGVRGGAKLEKLRGGLGGF